MQESKTLHYILGISLVMIAVFVVASLVMINSQADNNQANTNVVINDDPPTLLNLTTSSAANAGTGINNAGDSTMASSGINLISGGNLNLYLNGLVTDPNGIADIAGVEARFYRKSDAGKTGAYDPTGCVGADGANGATKNYCFYQGSCTTDTNSPADSVNKKRFSCQVQLPFYTAGTGTGSEFDNGTTTVDDYGVQVIVVSGSAVKTTLAGTFDTVASAGGGSGAVRRINTLTSLSIPTAQINYGNMAIGAQTAGSAGQAINVAQAGNDVADTYVYAPTTGGNLACNVLGSIVATQQDFNQANNGWGGGGFVTLPAEGTSTTTAAGFTLGYKPDAGTSVSDTLYMNIKIPNGVAGTCVGKINMITFAV